MFVLVGISFAASFQVVLVFCALFLLCCCFLFCLTPAVFLVCAFGLRFFVLVVFFCSRCFFRAGSYLIGVFLFICSFSACFFLVVFFW